MRTIDRIIGEFGETGVETTFKVSDQDYRVFAYPSLGRYGSRIRWNLYELDEGGRVSGQGLTFGIADGVREAVEDVVRAAELHASTGRVSPLQRGVRTFRPSPDG